MKPTLPPKSEIDQVMSLIYSDFCRENPYNFVMTVFPWGQKGFPLEHKKGPRAWQKRELLAIADHIKKNKEKVARGEQPEIYKLAVSSGRGIGKSALVSWITLWFMSSVLGGTCIISANTDDQISNKTFGEVGRWRTLMLNGFFWDQTQKNISPAPWYEKLLVDEMKIDCTYHYARGVLWDPERPDAFAGAHSQHGMLLVFDESSGIDESIWTVSQGFFTENTIYRFWLAFSNPRSNAGAFYDCFLEDSSWNTRNINALDVEDMDHSELLEIVKKHGEDSDKARIEVFGQFPKHGDRQFISRSIVEDAAKREIENYKWRDEPLILGVDVARFGDDYSVLAFRSGRDARTIPAQIYSGLDNMQLVQKIEQAAHTFNPDYICIDAGAGAGVIDRMRQLGYVIQEVDFGSASLQPQYIDHRTELYGRLRDWLPGGMIPDDRDLKTGLCAPEKELVGRESREKLESKQKMKKRGIKSPDFADALAITFSVKGAKRNLHSSRKGKPKRYREARGLLD